jgi:antitoxin ParD1/3/4
MALFDNSCQQCYTSIKEVQVTVTTMNISLPDALKAFVDEQIAKGGYSSASEYIRELIRHAEKQVAQERLEAALLEGLESGEPSAVTPEFWQERRKALEKRLNKPGRSRKDT